MSTTKEYRIHTRFSKDTLCVINSLINKRGRSTVVRSLVDKAISDAYQLGVQVKVVEKLRERRIKNVSPEVLERITGEIRAQHEYSDLVAIGIHAGRPLTH